MNDFFTVKKINMKFLYIVLAATVLYLAYKQRAVINLILRPFIIAAVLSYLLNPIVKVFERKGIKEYSG